MGTLMVNWPLYDTRQIWKERNRRIFKDQFLSSNLLIPKIKTDIEVINGNPRTSFKYFNEPIKEMESKQSFSKPAMSNIQNKHKNKTHIFQQAPTQNWVNLNFEGASKCNPGNASFGAIMRNDHDDLISSTYGNIGVTASNKAEIHRRGAFSMHRT